MKKTIVLTALFTLAMFVSFGAVWHYVPMLFVGAGPTGYTIAATPPSLNAINDTQAGLTITGGSPGYTYNYSVASSGTAVTLCGSGASSTTNTQVANATLSTTGATLIVANVSRSATNTKPALIDNLNNSYVLAASTTGNAIASDLYYVLSPTTSATTILTATGAANTFPSVQAMAFSGIGLNYSSSGGFVTNGTSTTGSVTLSNSTGGLNITSLADALASNTAPTGYTALATTYTAANAYYGGIAYNLSNSNTATTTAWTTTSGTSAQNVAQFLNTPQLFGSGTVNSNKMTVPRFSVTGLAPGTLAFSATLTDTSGNVGSTVTATAPFNPNSFVNYSTNNTPNDPFTHNQNNGGILTTSTYGIVGNGTLTIAASLSSVSLSGSVSNPCSQIIVCTPTAGVLLGSTTATGTLPLPANVPMTFPLSNTNLLYASGSSSGTGQVVGYMFVQ
jgi:hypothetical protein